MKSSCCAITLLILASLALQPAQSKPRKPASLAPVADCIQPMSSPDAVLVQPLGPVTKLGAQPGGQRLPVLPLAAQHAVAQGTDADILPLELVSASIAPASPAAGGEERPIQPRDLPPVPSATKDHDAAAARRAVHPPQPKPLPRVSAVPLC